MDDEQSSECRGGVHSRGRKIGQMRDYLPQQLSADSSSGSSGISSDHHGYSRTVDKGVEHVGRVLGVCGGV